MTPFLYPERQETSILRGICCMLPGRSRSIMSQLRTHATLCTHVYAARMKFTAARHLFSITTHLPIRMFVKFSYLCQLFSSYKALFGKPPNARAYEARLDRLVEVSARSVHSGARGRRSKFFFPAGVDKTISLVSIREAFFCTYVPLKCRHFFCPSCTRVLPGSIIPGSISTYPYVFFNTTHKTDNRQTNTAAEQ